MVYALILSKLSVYQIKEHTTTLFENYSTTFIFIVALQRKKVNNYALCEELYGEIGISVESRISVNLC